MVILQLLVYNGVDMGKAEENKSIKRNALLSHAFSLFMDKGVSSTSISDITEHAGVGKGTFYSYFRDKDDLIQKLVAQKGEKLFLHAVNQLKKQKEMSVDDSIIFIVDDIIGQLISDTKLHRFINKNLMFGAYRRAIAEGLQNDNDFLEYYYRLIEKDGDEWDEPLLMLYTIVELTGSTCHSIVLDKEPVEYEQYKPYLFKCIRSIISVYRK